MKKLIVLTAACVPLVTALVPATASTGPGAGRTDGATPCSAVHVDAPKGTNVVAVTATASPGGTATFPASVLSPAQTIADVPASCDITVTLTHTGVHDRVTVKTRLPSDPAAWNGRFTGGSGYQAGDFGAPLASALKAGYVAAATDAGVGQSPVDVSAWALNRNGSVNTGLLTDFASRSVHDLAVVGNGVIRAYYGRSARYSYWNGCSTGGRQGYLEAQRYPNDFQGILAAAPAVNWDRFAVATLWPQVVFNEEHAHPTTCELDAFNTAAVKACDDLDGLADGIIDNPEECHWDPRRLIGTQVQCNGQTLTITAADAEVVRKIWEGPVTPDGVEFWYGPNKGASFDYLANSSAPFVIADQWVKYFVARDPGLDTTALTYEQFAALFRQSEREYNRIIGTDDPDLSKFAAAGGKLLSWQGQADQLVPTQGTVDYRQRVNETMGGDNVVDQFYRLFLLPGVAHCGGGAGTQPTDALAQLVNWVERGQAPTALATSANRPDGTAVTRDVCRYPQLTQYVGTGDPDAASSYRCIN